MSEPEIDVELIDDAVLALMFLTLHKGRDWEPWRAWKSFDWAALGRLHEKDLILDPVGKAKSVALTDEGHRRCEEAYHRLFAKRADQAATGS
jgi:hypothetical protein